MIAPGFSTDSEVGQLMATKSAMISELFKAEALTDAPTDTAIISDYSAVPEWKQNNNQLAANQTVCWPMVKLGDTIYYHSTHLAAATCLMDSKTVMFLHVLRRISHCKWMVLFVKMAQRFG